MSVFPFLFNRVRLTMVATATSLLPALSAAAEPWADPALPVRDGLVLWLDAARLAEGRAALGKPAPREGDPVDLWPDASGNGLHAAQDTGNARPVFRPTDAFAAVRFDGRETALRVRRPGASSESATVFIVAAPYSPAEWFSAFFSASAPDANDFQSGINIDQAIGDPRQIQVLNVEGAGMVGVQDLLDEPREYGSVLRLCVVSSPGKGATYLRLDGKRAGARDRAAGSRIRWDEIAIGARRYSHGGPPEVRASLDGDIAELIVFDRALAEDEIARVEEYLAKKHGSVKNLPVPRAVGGKPLVRVERPPPVQMLVPGFSVKVLPVDLPNINNVLYGPDGKLIALGYDGVVWLLSDGDGDGIEDRADVFWDGKGTLRGPIGMALTPPGCPHGRGVIVAAKGKCSIIADRDGDGKADGEVVIADGWTELAHGVDALGVAVHPADRSIYFGIGTRDFTDAYGLGKDATPYRLDSERGTILRIAPDLRSREIVATGIRFPVALRFNALGDLFATDQEGATWLPNGNPLDELLHIQRGRHYGFPPRHPKHLPGVIDEPSVFDYSPQHQSTCGLAFDEPVNGGKTFGPETWRSDALVAGYSRGKVWRTKLVKTRAGYVAGTQLIANLGMLAADLCISPAGDLVIAAHGGGPDWGSGPSGSGKLYKVLHARKDLPVPVLAWAQGLREARVAFDRPLDPALIDGLAGKVVIESGKHVAAGDRFESLWPGYRVVQDQMRTARFELPTRSIQVTPDRRTLVIATAPHEEPAGYAVTLPGLGRPAAPAPGELPQAPETDVRYDLSGVGASWRPESEGDPWSGWLPHLDLEAASALTRGSAEHEALWARARGPGELSLRTLLDLRWMLHPAIQPGSRIDHEYPTERVKLAFRSRSRFSVRIGEEPPVAAAGGDAEYAAEVSAAGADRVPVAIAIRPGEGSPDLSVSWSTAEDPRPRALPLRRVLLPWAPAGRAEAPPGAAPAPAVIDAPELAGGNWARGRRIFFGEEAACSRCHRVGGEGGDIGPDLSNLPHRDYGSVLRDITEPSFAIHPDHIQQVVLLADGAALAGSVRTRGDEYLVGDSQGKVTRVARGDVISLEPSSTSSMPEDLPRLLGPERLRDLLTFLLAEPPRMPDYGKEKPPEPRRRSEVEAVLAGAPPGGAPRPIGIVLVTGPKDHGPGEHDYPAWEKAWSRLLRMSEGTEVRTARDWPSAEDLRSANVLVFFQQGKFDAGRAKDLDAFLERGGGAVYIHYAVDGGADPAGFARRIGLAWQGGRSKFRHGHLDLDFGPGAGHPITRGLGKLHLHDESYWQLVGDPARITLLATAPDDGKPQPLIWTVEHPRGRVFVSIPGHYSWSFDDPVFRTVLLRGIAWAAGEPVDRFAELALPGARAIGD